MNKKNEAEFHFLNAMLMTSADAVYLLVRLLIFHVTHRRIRLYTLDKRDEDEE